MNILDRHISNQSATIITSFFKLLIVFLVKFFCQMSLKKCQKIVKHPHYNSLEPKVMDWHLYSTLLFLI